MKTVHLDQGLADRIERVRLQIARECPEGGPLSFRWVVHAMLSGALDTRTDRQVVRRKRRVKRAVRQIIKGASGS
jgi:hypothetical protein